MNDVIESTAKDEEGNPLWRLDKSGSLVLSHQVPAGASVAEH